MPGRFNYKQRYLSFIYEQCDNIISRTCEIFATRFPKNQKPSSNTIKKDIQNFGSVRAKVEKRKPLVRNEKTDIANLEYFTHTRMSTRQLAIVSIISQLSILF